MFWEIRQSGQQTVNGKPQSADLYLRVRAGAISFSSEAGGCTRLCQWGGLPAQDLSSTVTAARQARRGPSPSPAFNFWKPAVRPCPTGGGEHLCKRGNKQTEIGQRSENISMQFHCSSASVLQNRAPSSNLSTGSALVGSSTKGSADTLMMHVFLAGSSGTTTVTVAKKRKSCSKKIGDQSRRLHLHPGTRTPVGLGNFEFRFRISGCVSSRNTRKLHLDEVWRKSLALQHSPRAPAEWIKLNRGGYKGKANTPFYATASLGIGRDSLPSFQQGVFWILEQVFHNGNDPHQSFFFLFSPQSVQTSSYPVQYLSHSKHASNLRC